MKIKTKNKSVIIGHVQYNENREFVVNDEIGKKLIDGGHAIEIKEVKVKKETKELKDSKETKESKNSKETK